MVCSQFDRVKRQIFYELLKILISFINSVQKTIKILITIYYIFIIQNTMINIIILLFSIQFQFQFGSSQQCSFPNQRCICSTANPYCPCSLISGDALLNTSSNYNSHLILVSGQGCKPCGPACRKCSNAPSICVDCYQQYYLTNSTCEPCPINCRTCSGKVCLDCVYGFYLDYKKNCQACPLQGSKQCSLTQIKSCWNNYWLDNNGALCVNCDVNCAKCQSMTRCQTCNSGYYTNIGKCYKCKSECLTCDNQNSCLICLQSNYYFNTAKSVCEAISTSNCKVANRNNTCKQCQNQYALILGSTNLACKSITSLGVSEIPYCSLHEWNQTLNKLICASCKSGFYKAINKNYCFFGCSHMCTSCRGPHYGLCSACSEGAKLQNYHCIPNYNLQNGAVYQIMYTAQTNPAKFLGATTIFSGNCFEEVFAGGSSEITIKLDKLNSYKIAVKWKTYIYKSNSINNSSYEVLWNPTSSNFKVIKQPEYCPNSSYINQITPSCQYVYCISKQMIQISTDINLNNTITFKTRQNSVFLGLSQIIILGYRCGGVIGSSCALCSDISSCTKCYDSSYYISGQLCLSECPAIKYTYQKNKTCYSNCPSKTYSQESLRQCFDCHSPCLTCQSISFCLTCEEGYFLFSSSGQCLEKCPAKYFGDSYKGTCDSCVFPCLQCQSNTKCTSCMYGYLDNKTQICATQCPTKYYGDIESGTCQPCKQPCNTCFNSEDNCQTCIPNYLYLNYQCLIQCPQGYYQNESACQLCHQSCTSCSITSKNCTKCSSGYLLQNICYYQCPSRTFKNVITMTCEVCSEQCQTCSEFPSKCLSCSNNYFYIIEEMKCISSCYSGTYQSDGKCLSCPLPCFTCTNISSCLSCFDMFLYEDKCISQCPSGTYAQMSSLSCKTCNKTACKQCENSPNNCTQCLSTQILFKQTCILQCPQGFYLNQVTFPKQCISCIQPCQKCLNEQACFSCATPYILLGLSCLRQCPFGMFLYNNTCLFCQSNCLTCQNNSNTCFECSTGYSLFQGNNSCLLNCPNGYYSYDRVCYKCLPPCQFCKQQYFCQKCLDTFGGFFGGSCLANCPQTYYYNSVLNVCEKCSSNCSTCYETSRNCTSCNSPYYLQYITLQSINYSRSCLISCNHGQYSQKLNNRCLPCSSICFTCSVTSENCTSCLPSYVFLNGKCLKKCSQSYYYYIDGNKNAYCKQCPINCQSCQNNTYCTSCKSGTSITQNNECLQACPSGYYSASGVCLKCEYPCNNCISQLQCLTCIRGYLYQYQCIFSCPSSTYLNTTTNQCINCPTGCLACKNATYCEICDIGYLHYGFCLDNCPIGYYSQFSHCSSCPQGCSQCKNSSNCLQCSEGYQYLGGCVQQCSYGWVATIENNTKICQVCESPCLTCIQTINMCISCVSGTLLYLNKCESNCPAGTYINYQLQHCSSCKLPCQTCKNAYSCQTCIYGFILYQQDQKNQCVQGPYCPNSYYLDLDESICKFECIDKFIQPIHRTCSNICPDQYVHLRQNLTCLIKCPNNMWIDLNYSCRPLSELNGLQLPFFSCSQTEVRNLMVFDCSVTLSLSNLEIINKKNFTTSVGVIEQYFYKDDRNFYLVIADTQQDHLYLKWATISVTYRYGLKSQSISSNKSRLLQQQNNIPLQNIKVQAFIYNFHSYTYLQRQIGLHMMEISQSITIGVLILWFLALLKNASPVSLLLVIGTQYLYSISLIETNFAPNFNQFLEGFKISQFYFFGITSENFDSALWNISNSNRVQLQALVDIGNFTQTLLPCIFIFIIFLFVFLLTFGLSRILPKVTQHQVLLDIAIKADIINCRFNHNYWHQCVLLLTSPISLFFFAQILLGHLIGILIGVFFILAILIFTIRVFYRMNYVTRAQRPSKQFFCFMVFEIIILNGLAIWSSIYIFAGASIALFIMNLFFWQKLFSSRWIWKSIHCQIFDVARILLMVLTCVGQFKLVDLDSSTLYFYGWIEVAVVFIIVISVAVLQTRQFFGISNKLLVAGLVGLNENLIKNSSDSNEQNDEDQIDNRSFFVQQQAVEYSDSQEDDIIDFDDINTNLGFQKPASTLIRYDRNRNDNEDL